MGLFSSIGGLAGSFFGGPLGGAAGSFLGSAIDGSGNSSAVGSAGNAYDAKLQAALQALNAGSTEEENRLKPTADIGTNSIGRLNDILVNGDMSKFYDNPAYKYALDQSQRGIQANAASKGTLMSGSTLKALQSNASGFASQNYNSYISNLSNLFNQSSPYLTSYDQLPYQKAQDQANILVGQGANQRDTILGQQNDMSGIGSNLTGLGSGLSSLFGGFGSSGSSGDSYNSSFVNSGSSNDGFDALFNNIDFGGF